MAARNRLLAALHKPRAQRRRVYAQPAPAKGGEFDYFSWQ